MRKQKKTKALKINIIGIPTPTQAVQFLILKKWHNFLLVITAHIGNSDVLGSGLKREEEGEEEEEEEERERGHQVLVKSSSHWRENERRGGNSGERPPTNSKFGKQQKGQKCFFSLPGPENQSARTTRNREIQRN